MQSKITANYCRQNLIKCIETFAGKPIYSFLLLCLQYNRLTQALLSDVFKRKQRIFHVSQSGFEVYERHTKKILMNVFFQGRTSARGDDRRF